MKNRRLLTCLILIVLALQSVASVPVIAHSINLQTDSVHALNEFTLDIQAPCDHCSDNGCNDSCTVADGCASYCSALILPTSPLAFIAINSRNESSVFVAQSPLKVSYSPLKPPNIEP